LSGVVSSSVLFFIFTIVLELYYVDFIVLFYLVLYYDLIVVSYLVFYYDRDLVDLSGGFDKGQASQGPDSSIKNKAF
jgi:hypothetical protein